MPYPIAYQLYSSRHFPPLEAQFPELRAMGYDAIEPWLPAYETNPKGFRRALDDSGLKCFGFHLPLSGLVTEPDRFIDIALGLGATWLIPPWVGAEERQPTPGWWCGLGEKLATAAERAKPHGLRVAWHNHDFEFEPFPGGSRPIDHLFEAAGPDVWFELDCGWVKRSGADPADVLQKFADRIGIIQTKDMAPRGTLAEGGWAATGDGIIDWESLVPLFRATKATHLVTEHDDPADWRVFAKRSINHLRELGL